MRLLKAVLALTVFFCGGLNVYGFGEYDPSASDFDSSVRGAP